MISWIHASEFSPSDYASAFDFKSDGILYRYNDDGQSVSVTYMREKENQHFYDIKNSYTGDVIVPSEVSYEGVVYPVTGVDKYTFARCSGLTSVQLPATITNIDSYVFYGSSALKSVNIPIAVTSIGFSAFSYSGIESITIPEGVEKIASSTFRECRNLKTVILPESVTEINLYAFAYCKSLENISLPNSLTSIGERAFYECSSLKAITIPESVKRIDSYAFSQTGLSSVNILCNLAEMENGEFLNISTGVFLGGSTYGEVLTVHVIDFYSGLALCLNQSFNNGYFDTSDWRPYRLFVNSEEVTHFTIPENVIAIPANSFNGLQSLRTVELPSNLQLIEEKAFYQCTNLKKVSMSGCDDLATIQRNAFSGCSSLAEVTFGKGIKSIGQYAFQNCTNISKVDIGDIANWCSVDFDPGNDIVNRYSWAWKDNYANPLYYAKKIYLDGIEQSELRIPTGVKRIGGWAFLGCARFDKVTIPASVEYIGVHAFSGCVDLAEISFRKGSKLDTLAAGAFYGCVGLTNVVLPESVADIGNDCFNGCKNLQVAVIPAQVKNIGSSSFYECIKLQDVRLSDGLATIGSNAFYGCSSLERIEIPTTLNYIGLDAFMNCNSLQGVYISDLAAWCKISMPGTASKNGFANNPLFYAHNLYLNNELLTDLTIPEEIESVEANTFAGATCLKSVTIPESCKRLGSGTFYDCSNIESIRIPAAITFDAESAKTGGVNRLIGPFNCITQTNVKLYIEDLEEWINSLGDKFSVWSYNWNTDYHVSLYVHDKLVTDLIVPENITKMNGAFYGFDFTTVTLPAGLETITEDAFRYCTKLKYMYSRSRFAPTGATGLNTAGYYKDRHPSSLQAIYVPAGRSNNYKTSWTKNADIIFEAPENVSMSGTISSQSLVKDIMAHIYVYDDAVPYLDLTESVLDKDVTQEALQPIADHGTIIFLPVGTEGIEGTNIVANGRTPKLILRDSTDFKAPYDFTADELVHKRTFKASNTEITTMCLPYSLAELPKGMKAFLLTGQDADGNMMFSETDAVDANKPYLVLTTLAVDSLSVKNAQVKATPDALPDGGCDGYEFRGSLSNISHDDAADSEMYVIGTGKEWLSVYDADYSVCLPSGRAYLKPTEGATTISIGIVFNSVSPLDTPADANNDGVIDVSDFTATAHYLLGNTPEGFNPKAADANNDGIVDVADLTATAHIILYGSIIKPASSRKQIRKDPQ